MKFKLSSLATITKDVFGENEKNILSTVNMGLEIFCVGIEWQPVAQIDRWENGFKS